jgi:hypothetical protein
MSYTSTETIHLQVSSLPARLTRRIPLPYAITILLFWSLEFITDYVVLWRLPEADDYYWAHVGIMAFFASITIMIIYCSNILMAIYPDLASFVDQDKEEFRLWYIKKLKWCLEGKWPIVSGILFVVLQEITVGSIIQSSVTFDRPFLQALWVVYLIVGFFMLGYGLWAMLNVAIIPIQLSRFKLKVSLNQISGIGLQALGTAYFKMALSISVSFLILILMVMVSPLSGETSVLVWEILAAVMIFSFFLLPQMGVHGIMALEKKKSLTKLSVPLEEAIQRSVDNPTSENTMRLKELLELQHHIKSMNDWPFNVNTLWQLLTALLIPLLLALLEIFF